MIHIKVKMRKNLMALLGNTGSDLGASSSSFDGRVTEKTVGLEKEMATLSSLMETPAAEGANL